MTRAPGAPTELFRIDDANTLYVNESGYYLLGLYYQVDDLQPSEVVTIRLQNNPPGWASSVWLGVHEFSLLYPGPGMFRQYHYDTQLMYLKAGERLQISINSNYAASSSSALTELRVIAQKLH